jgi:hypothetical protein
MWRLFEPGWVPKWLDGEMKRAPKELGSGFSEPPDDHCVSHFSGRGSERARPPGAKRKPRSEDHHPKPRALGQDCLARDPPLLRPFGNSRKVRFAR